MMLTYTAIIGRQLLPPQHHILPHKDQKTPKPRALPHNSPATRTVPVYQRYTQNPKHPNHPQPTSRSNLHGLKRSLKNLFQTTQIMGNEHPVQPASIMTSKCRSLRKCVRLKGRMGKVDDNTISDKGKVRDGVYHGC